MSFDQKVMQAQGVRITALNDELLRAKKALQDAIDERNRYKPAAEFWFDMQRQIKDNPAIRSAWEEFLVTLKLGADDAYIKRAGG